MAIAAGLAGPATLMMEPSTAGAATSKAAANPLGPTEAQLQQFYETALGNTQSTLQSLLNDSPLGLVESLIESGALQCDLENITYLLPFYGGGPPPCAGYF
jgi:hypothetical protein